MAITDELEIVIEHEGKNVLLAMNKFYEHNKIQRVIQSFTEDGQPWAVFSICIPGAVIRPGQTIINSNEFPEILSILEKRGIVTNTDAVVESGYCKYPIVEFT